MVQIHPGYYLPLPVKAILPKESKSNQCSSLFLIRQDLPSPTSEGNSKVLEDLENDRTKLTSEANGTDDQCKEMEDRQPDANHNNELNRSDSRNGGNLSPSALTSFHGLNIIAEQMGQGEEGNTIGMFKCLVKGFIL